MITDITTKEYQDLDTAQAKLVEVYSQTCAPCKMLAIVLKDVEKELPDFPIYTIDFTNNGDIKDVLAIRGVPTLIFIKDGKEVIRISGLQEKATIIKHIETLTA